MTQMQFYNAVLPTKDELVLVQFIKRHDSFFEAILLEYKCGGMMNYKDATKKRKISSWNKIIPLNKNMVARVDEINLSSNSVQLSIAYLEVDTTEDLTPEQIQSKLMIQFTENKIMENFIKSVCIINSYDFTEIWTTLVYYIDSLRIELNEEEDEYLSLWNYFKANISDLDDWLEEVSLDRTIGDAIKELYEKRTEESICKITSRIGIISPGGIGLTKTLLETTIPCITFPYTFKYDTTPYYLFESSSDTSSIDDHTKIIKLLEQNASKMTPKVFIKIA